MSKGWNSQDFCDLIDTYSRCESIHAEGKQKINISMVIHKFTVAYHSEYITDSSGILTKVFHNMFEASITTNYIPNKILKSIFYAICSVMGSFKMYK